MFLLWPSLILAIYVFCSGILPLKISWWCRALMGIVVLAIALKYQAYTFGGGTFFEPAVKGSLLLIWEALYGALVIAAFLLLIKDISTLGLWLLKFFGVSLSFSLNRNAVLFSILTLSIVSGFWGLYEAVRVPDVRNETISIKNLPAVWGDTRIVLLSDLHIGPVQGREWLQKIVDKVNQLQPDLILITGDFVDGQVSRILPELAPLKSLRSELGVYAIPGNHEYYSGYSQWMKALPTLGIHMLENGNATLQKEGEKLIIAGVTDLGSPRFGMEGPNIGKAFEGTDEKAVRILLAHQPKTSLGSKERFDLQLSGHTHGGHMFFMYPLLAYFNDGLVSGLYEREGYSVYVNRGTGLWNGFSQRVGVPSEITLITLK